MPTSPTTHAMVVAITAFVDRAIARSIDVDRYRARRPAGLGPWPDAPLRDALIEDLRRAAGRTGVELLAETARAVVAAGPTDALRGDMARLLEAVDDAHTMPAVRPPKRRRRRRWPLLAGAGALLVALVGAGAFWWLSADGIEAPETPEAVEAARRAAAARAGSAAPPRPPRPFGVLIEDPRRPIPVVDPRLELTSLAAGWARWSPPGELAVGGVGIAQVRLGVDDRPPPRPIAPGAGAARLPMSGIMKVELVAMHGRVEVQAETPPEQPVGPDGARWSFHVRGVEPGAERLRLVILARVEVEGQTLYREVEIYEHPLEVQAIALGGAEAVVQSRRSAAPPAPLKAAPPAGGSGPEAPPTGGSGALDLMATVWALPLLATLVALLVVGWRRGRRGSGGRHGHRRGRTPILLLLFANADRGSSGHLRELSSERKAIQDALEPAVAQRRCRLAVEPEASIDDVFDLIGKYSDRIIGVHYAGHGIQDALLLEIEEGGGSIAARAEGLAKAMARLPRLRFVFLNACESDSLIDEVHAQVEAPLIVTDGSIDDGAAADFATRFYRSLAAGNSIEDAYHDAEAEAECKAGDAGGVVRSGVRRLDRRPAEPSGGAADLPWRLVWHPRAAEAVSWSLRDE